MAYKKADFYFKKAKEEGYLSRAAYKLKELNEKFNLIRKGFAVIDLGAAPGGWSQVALELVGKKGFVLAVDLLPIMINAPNFTSLVGDITKEECKERVRGYLERADIVISDVAPRTSGIVKLDQGRSIDLAFSVIDFSKEFLADGGSLLMKVFDGGEVKDLLAELSKLFGKVKIHKPPASRKESKEVYVVALGFKA